MTLQVPLDTDSEAYEDIRKYLEAEFDKICKNRIKGPHLSTSWPSEKEIDQLVRKSSGQFIYAATVVRYVSAFDHSPVDRLMATGKK